MEDSNSELSATTGSTIEDAATGNNGREKQTQTFYASIVDKNTNKTMKKLSFNIEICLPQNHELVLGGTRTSSAFDNNNSGHERKTKTTKL